jgi:acyl carrier protein phosphodiesterase
MRSTSAWARGLTGAGVAALAALLAGCGGQPSASGSAAGLAAAGHGATVAGSQYAAYGQAARNGPTAGPARASTAGQLRLAGPDIVYTAEMTLRVAKVSRAAARAAAIAGHAGGYVSGENEALRSGARQTASITLKIPVAAFAQVVSELSTGLGIQTYLNQQAQDVTEQVADTASRVASAQAAIAQLRTLLRDAGSVSALLTVQNQISAQESALEALQAQQRALDHQTTYATVSLQLLGPPAAATHNHKARPASGFTGGLTAGWNALRGVASWLLRALGAALPIGAVLALAIFLGYRGYRMLRRRSGQRAKPAVPPSGS